MFAPVVSIVMPVYNGAPFLDRALASVRAQALTDWELIAVDDASADDSLARLRAFAATEPRARVLRHPTNRGQAAARNTALTAARGAWVAYLDQDDEFYPGHLARAWEHRAAGDVLVFRYDLVEERPGHPGLGTVTTYDPARRARALFDETIAVPLGVVHRRDLLARSGMFDEAMGRHRGRDEDGDLWRRFARAGARFAYLPERSGRYHVRAESFARTRPPAPATPRTVTVTVCAGAGRYPLWLPAADTWLVNQIFERHEYGGVAPAWLRRPPVVIDVGANAGTFALYAKLAYHPDAVVHCFEPCPATFELLRANVARFAGVTAHPVGLGREDGTAELLLDPKNPAAHSFKPALVPAPAGRVRVPMRDAGGVWDELRLDDVDVLKIDAEGCEVDVLEALGGRLGRVRVALIEYHTPGDRRRIDELLPGHTRFGAQAHTPAVGVVKYVRADIARGPGAGTG